MTSGKMHKLPKKGQTWGALKVLNVNVYRNGPNDDPDCDDFGIVFQCRCGKIFTKDSDEWEGRRNLRDCGCNRFERMQRKVLVSVGLERGDRLLILALARESGISEASMIRMLIETSLEPLRENAKVDLEDDD